MKNGIGLRRDMAASTAGSRFKLTGLGLAVLALVIAPQLRVDSDSLQFSNAAMAKNARSEAMAGGRTGGHATQAGRGDIRGFNDRGADGFADRGNRQSRAQGAVSTAGISATDDTMGMTRSWKPKASTEVASTGRSRSIGAVVNKRASGGKSVIERIQNMREVGLNEERQLLGNWDN